MSIQNKQLKKLLHMSDEILEKIINDELEKPENEMNAELIALCSEALYRRHTPHTNKYVVTLKTKSHVKKIILIAAVLSLLLASVAIAFAEYHENDVKEKYVIAEDGIITRIDTKINDTTPLGYALMDTDLAKKINEKGIEKPVTLPEVLTSGEYKISDIKGFPSEGWGQLPSLTVQVDFKTNKCDGYIAITQSDVPYDSMTEIINLKAIEQYTVNGLDILLFSFNGNNSNYLIKYYDSVQHINYNMSVNCSHQTAEYIIESIK